MTNSINDDITPQEHDPGTFHAHATCPFCPWTASMRGSQIMSTVVASLPATSGHRCSNRSGSVNLIL